MTEPRNAAEETPEAGQPAGTAAAAQRDKVQKQLDEALADSFPASDPVSIVTSHQEDWDAPENES
jgi:hypothetical protein